MRIGIESHYAERVGGGDCTYTQNLIKNLAILDKKNEYVLYCVNKDLYFYEEILKINKNFKMVELRIKNVFFRIPFILGYRTYKDKIDVLHTQYYCPLFSRAKRVITIHDIIPIIYPKFFNWFEILKQKFFLYFFIKLADKIVTGSDCSKKDITTYLKVKNNKIDRIYNGISEDFKVINNVNKINILKKFKIEDPYIYYIGRLNPRKNLENLIRAFSGIVNNKIILVIAGRKNKYFYKIDNLVKKFKLNGKIKFLDFVSNEENIILLNFAEFFIYLSIYEGFGLPVLEAMACGCPVITSKGSSLEEIAKDCAMLVNPKSIEDIENAMFKLLKDKNLRKELVRRGFEKIKEFTWQITARRTLEIYEHLVNKV